MAYTISDEHALELIWTSIVEHGSATSECLTGLPEHEVRPEDCQRLVEKGLVRASGRQLCLTKEGEAHAEAVVRRHRLAERLMADVLELDEASSASSACRFEHVLSDEVTESICILLGHPTQCPHGHPIPPGPCCKRARNDLESLVRPLASLRSGQEARIAYVASRRRGRLDRLATLGLLPNRPVRVHQRFPSMVVRVGETDIAIDREIAGDIFVRVMKS
ncbi:metal-dependent transcriptional regulator [bacterium]|nr:metal-dependent transcriptional regulator [bacterium]